MVNSEYRRERRRPERSRRAKDMGARHPALGTGRKAKGNIVGRIKRSGSGGVAFVQTKIAGSASLEPAYR